MIPDSIKPLLPGSMRRNYHGLIPRSTCLTSAAMGPPDDLASAADAVPDENVVPASGFGLLRGRGGVASGKAAQSATAKLINVVQVPAAAPAKDKAKDAGDGDGAKKKDDAGKPADAKKSDDKAKDAGAAKDDTKKGDDKGQTEVAKVTTEVKAPAGMDKDPVFHYQVELLSRQVMRVVIPRGVYSMNGAVDVHIATPYGASPHLEIPILCPRPVPILVPVPLPPLGYVVPPVNSKMQLQYRWLSLKGKMVPALVDGSLSGSFVLEWHEPTGSALRMIDVTFAFAAPGLDHPVRITVPQVVARDGSFEIAGPQALALAVELLQTLTEQGKFTPQQPLPPLVLSVEITATPRDPQGRHAVKRVGVAGAVTVELRELP
jgi:hypothetical protein